VDAPLVSVVIAVRDGAATLQRCLGHLRAQTHAAVEVIVVDDGSRDDSAALAEATAGDIRVLRQPPRGASAARNAGVRAARGDYVAFIDADGYADPDWLAASVAALQSDATLGAVAPLVFFDAQPLILNGAGGTLNRRGYARDWAFDEPYELATLPHEVLYAMTCGAVVRRSVLEAIGPLDEVITVYYEDVELGVRIWASGARIVVCPRAQVAHGFQGAGAQPLRAERHRIRTVLKYYPTRQLPGWLLQELRLLVYLRCAGQRLLPFAVWGWNLRHLASAWAIRRRFVGAAPRYWPLVADAWRLPPAQPPNHGLRPDATRVGAQLRFDGVDDAPALRFGWYDAADAGWRRFRPSAPTAAALVRLSAPASRCTLVWRGAPSLEHATLAVRRIDERQPLWSTALPPPPRVWEQRRLACALPPGLYEVLLAAAPGWTDASHRLRGADVAAIGFDGGA
jgi:GT2 family glycosyltransferase